MRSLKVLFMGMLLFSLTGVLFANESPIYVRSTPITRVYSHQLGYRILYARNNQTAEVFYVPLRWFSVSAQTGEPPKAEVVFGNDASYPYFSIFWKDGQFEFIRLYLERDRNALSWGSLDGSVNITDRFDIDSLDVTRF